MPLNAEELYAQKKFERDQYARPTKEQLEIALLEQQLEHAQNTISHLDNYVDKQTDKLDRINGHIQKYVTGKRKKGVTLDNIIHTMGWKR